MDGFDGVSHFGVWPFAMAAGACFGTANWSSEVLVPNATIEFELASVEAVQVAVHAAVEEMKAQGREFIHAARLEPWGADRGALSEAEGVLVGLSYAPWQHE